MVEVVRHAPDAALNGRGSGAPPSDREAVESGCVVDGVELEVAAARPAER